MSRGAIQGSEWSSYRFNQVDDCLLPLLLLTCCLLVLPKLLPRLLLPRIFFLPRVSLVVCARGPSRETWKVKDQLYLGRTPSCTSLITSNSEG